MLGDTLGACVALFRELLERFGEALGIISESCLGGFGDHFRVGRETIRSIVEAPNESLET